MLLGGRNRSGQVRRGASGAACGYGSLSGVFAFAGLDKRGKEAGGRKRQIFSQSSRREMTGPLLRVYVHL